MDQLNNGLGWALGWLLIALSLYFIVKFHEHFIGVLIIILALIEICVSIGFLPRMHDKPNDYIKITDQYGTTKTIRHVKKASLNNDTISYETKNRIHIIDIPDGGKATIPNNK